MGLFKSKEEREAEREQRRLEAERIAERVVNSPLTKTLQLFLMEQFGELNSEETTKLRQIGARGGGYIMEVRCDGVLFKLIDRSGECLDTWGLGFDSLGYENLPSAGQDALKKELLKTLAGIEHLKVIDTGFFRYEQNRTKQSW